MYHIMIILYFTIWWFNIAIENVHVKLIYPLNMVIFHSYVSLPEGIIYISHEITIVSLYSIEHNRSNKIQRSPAIRHFQKTSETCPLIIFDQQTWQSEIPNGAVNGNNFPSGYD